MPFWLPNSRVIKRCFQIPSYLLPQSTQSLQRKSEVKFTADYAAERVAGLMNMDASELFEPGKQRRRVQARSVLCYWAARELEMSMVKLCHRFKLSAAALTLSVQRGEKIVHENNYSLIDKN